jgi:hypothetical protein
MGQLPIIVASPDTVPPILGGAVRLPSPFNYPLESVGHPRVAFTIRDSQGGCCPGPIFSGGVFHVGDYEFSERFFSIVIGHRDPAFQRDWMDGQGTASLFNHPWHGSAMVPLEMATVFAAFNPV